MDPISVADFESRLRTVFDVCDPQNLGYITVERFVDLASEHFGADAINADELSHIIELLDPQEDGKIHFKDFCRGVNKIVELQQGQFCDGSILQESNVLSDSDRGRSRSLSHSPVSFWHDKNIDEDVRSAGNISTDNNRLDVIMANSSSTGTLIDLCNNDIIMPTLRVESPGTTISKPLYRNDKYFINDEGASGDMGIEHFEDFGEVETESVLTYSSSHSAEQGGSSSSPFGRLHRSSSKSLKSQKYRNSQNGSANTSRRSSISDVDVFGDIDGSFHELNEKVKNLEEQLNSITSSQSETDVRHLRLKDENQHLAGKVNHLEEQLKDVEIRSWEQRAAEQKRHIEIMLKQERAMVREVEQLRITTGNVQNECVQLKLDVDRYKTEIERLRLEKKDACYQLEDMRDAYESLKAEHDEVQEKLEKFVADIEQERRCNAELLDELSKELEELRIYKIENEQAARCRSPSVTEMPQRYREMSVEVKQLIAENNRLKEENQELQAQILNHTVSEGKKLLRGNSRGGPSIADEMGDLPREELLQALRDQEDVNRKLRDYVDRIILTIIEKNPSLLEVQPSHGPS